MAWPGIVAVLTVVLKSSVVPRYRPRAQVLASSLVSDYSKLVPAVVFIKGQNHVPTALLPRLTDRMGMAEPRAGAVQPRPHGEGPGPHHRHRMPIDMGLVPGPHHRRIITADELATHTSNAPRFRG